MVRTKSGFKLRAGDKAPNFNLKGIDEKFYTLEDFPHKRALLIVFICNHCPYVRARLPQLIELQKKFPHDLQILGINSNDPDYPGEGFANMKKFAKDFEINFPYVFDETQEVAKAYKATCTPDPFLFDENRKLVYHGRISDALSPEDKPTRFIMEENVEKLLSGEKIEKEFDYSIGCSIKWIK